MDDHIKTLAETILWLAEEQMKTEGFQNINSSIMALCMSLDLELIKFMKKNK